MQIVTAQSMEILARKFSGLSVDRLKRIMLTGSEPWALITSDRNTSMGRNPNRKNFSGFVRDLSGQHIKCRGTWSNGGGAPVTVERSVLVVGAVFDELAKAAVKYNQEAFVYSPGRGKASLYVLWGGWLPHNRIHVARGSGLTIVATEGATGAEAAKEKHTEVLGDSMGGISFFQGSMATAKFDGAAKNVEPWKVLSGDALAAFLAVQQQRAGRGEVGEAEV